MTEQGFEGRTVFTICDVRDVVYHVENTKLDHRSPSRFQVDGNLHAKATGEHK